MNGRDPRHPDFPSAGPGEPLPRDLSATELGRRIKLLRVARGLTLKDLEERGGISATHISEIERGKASPTVGALGRIARALNLLPATLIERRMLPAVTVVRSGERAARRVQWGIATLESVHEPVEGSSLGVHLMHLPIARDPALTHHHEGEEWLTVLSGVAEIRIDGHPYIMREGDSLHFRAHRNHSYANLASAPALLLVAGRPRLTL